jgi:hypothetical protein
MHLNKMSTADIVGTVEECLPHQLKVEGQSLSLPLTPREKDAKKAVISKPLYNISSCFD